MKLGLQVIGFDWPGGRRAIGTTLRRIAEAADRGGLDSLWVMDHLFQMGGAAGEPEAPMLEAYTTLGFLAAATERITLGALVTGYMYRYPGVLGKIATTLDVLASGRSWLGIGAGWYEEEARGLGTPFPPTGIRFEQLEETLEILHQMWRDDDSSYIGNHYELTRPLNRPQPVAEPHPPILIGTEGPRKGLRLVAKHADACNFYFGATDPRHGDWHHERYINSEQHLASMWATLGERCDEVGRDRAEIEFTTLGTVVPSRTGPGDSPDELVDFFGRIAAAGVEHVIVNIPGVEEMRQLEVLIEDVRPQLADM